MINIVIYAWANDVIYGWKYDIINERYFELSRNISFCFMIHESN